MGWKMGGMHPIPLLCNKWNGVESVTACRWTRDTCTGTSGSQRITPWCEAAVVGTQANAHQKRHLVVTGNRHQAVICLSCRAVGC